MIVKKVATTPNTTTSNNNNNEKEFVKWILTYHFGLDNYEKLMLYLICSVLVAFLILLIIYNIKQYFEKRLIIRNFKLIFKESNLKFNKNLLKSSTKHTKTYLTLTKQQNDHIDVMTAPDTPLPTPKRAIIINEHDDDDDNDGISEHLILHSPPNHYYDNIKTQKKQNGGPGHYDIPIVVKYNENALLNQYKASLLTNSDSYN